MELNVKEIEKDIKLVSVNGELDMYTTPSFKEFVNSSINGSVETCIIDCEELTYLDSSGVSAMFAAVEYWNCGVVFYEARNCVAVRRDFSVAS